MIRRLIQPLMQPLPVLSTFVGTCLQQRFVRMKKPWKAPEYREDRSRKKRKPRRPKKLRMREIFQGSKTYREWARARGKAPKKPNPGEKQLKESIFAHCAKV